MSVGAVNPNGTTDALFSNTGAWVRAYASGAAVMSTIPPTFQGGFNSMAGTEAYQRPRASIDPDDFSSGFALWSGTSFSAPLVRRHGRRSQLVDTIDPGQDDGGRRPSTAAGRPCQR